MLVVNVESRSEGLMAGCHFDPSHVWSAVRGHMSRSDGIGCRDRKVTVNRPDRTVTGHKVWPHGWPEIVIKY